MQLLPDIAQRLQHHEEALRIRKLLFCLCKKYWENDPNVLNTFSCEDLLTELINTRPTVEQLTFSLYKLVKTLNRPKVYAGVAKVILDQVTPLYDQINEAVPIAEAEPIDEEEGTRITMGEDKATQMVEPNPNFLIDQVTQHLATHREQSRIKKLVYCLCRSRWENNLAVIDNYGFRNLITDICQIYPTRNELKMALQKIVNNLNKHGLYLAIANIILQQLDVLYSNLPEEYTKDKEGSTQIYNTQIIQLNSISVPQQTNRHLEAFETSVVDVALDHDQGVTELKSIQPYTPPAPTPARPQYDLFEIRQSIFQYTNPLRAKILLFSIMFHPWDRSGEDWSMLRSYTLDDLIEQLIQSGRSVEDINRKLHSAAQVMNDPDLHNQAASTILETIKPYL